MITNEIYIFELNELKTENKKKSQRSKLIATYIPFVQLKCKFKEKEKKTIQQKIFNLLHFEWTLKWDHWQQDETEPKKKVK